MDIHEMTVKVTKENPFITNNSTNLTYCLEWAQEEAKRKKKTLNMRNDPAKGTVYGIVDMIGIFGEYASRDSEKKFWQRLRSERTQGQIVPVSSSRQFFVALDYFGKPMDFCTLTDFFDRVIPHMKGNVARTINTARSQVATLVGTGSIVAVEVTAINREAAENASEPIREAIEDMRSTTEQTVISNATTPVTIQSTLTEREWHQEHPYHVEYTNPIRGHVFYMRKSLAHFVTRVQPPPNSPLQLNVGKLGKTSDIVSRHSSYGKDFGVFTSAIVFETRDDLDLFERNVKSLIHKDRTSGTEYFDEAEVSARYKYNCTWDLYEEQARKLVADSVIGVYDTKITLSVDAAEIQPKLTDFFERSQTVTKQQPRPMVKVSVTFVQAEGERQIDRPRASDSGLELQLSNNTVEISRYAYETRKVEVDAQVELKRLEYELESKRLEHELESKKIDADMQKHANEIVGKTQVELKTEELKSETNKRELELTHEERLVEYELRKLEIETVHRGPHRQHDLTDAEKDAFMVFWNTCTKPSNKPVSCRALLDRYQQYTQGNLMLRVIDFNRRLKSIGVCVKRSLGNTGNGVERRQLCVD